MVNNSLANAEAIRDAGSVPGLGKPPGGGHGKPTPVFLPGESRGQTSLVASVLRVTESDTTEAT